MPHHAGNTRRRNRKKHLGHRMHRLGRIARQARAKLRKRGSSYATAQQAG